MLNKKGTIRTMQQVKNSLAVTYKKNQPTFYIFNYNGGGFSIIAGDDRIKPILAYSYEHSFPLSAFQHKKYPLGVALWLEKEKKGIYYIRANNIDLHKRVDSSLLKESVKKTKNAIKLKTMGKPASECTKAGSKMVTFDIYGPYMSSIWGQWYPYNSELQNLSCTYSRSHGYPPAGCEAVAMAQIMNYYQYPTNPHLPYIPWNDLIDDYAGSSHYHYWVARLLYIIGTYLPQSYSCGVASASMADAVNTFHTYFDYTSATYHNYDPDLLWSEIKVGRPVMLSGGTNSSNHYIDGHAWVCDGAVKYYRWMCVEFPILGHEWIMVNIYYSLYMNWGWMRGDFNGLYSATNFNPGSSTYNYERGMITNITP